MTDIPKYNDLCLTCVYGDECVRRKRHGKPVYYCEEFEYSLELPKKPVQKPIQNIGSEMSLTKIRDENGNPLGLCANCSSRKTCNHPKPQSGVWHCEDYC